MYEKIFEDIKIYLADSHGEMSKIGSFPFRKRSEHIMRVYNWAGRLMEGIDSSAVDKDAVLIAALFHDVGYAISSKGSGHAANSAAIFKEYAEKYDLTREKSEFISFLISNHSNKELMFEEGTPLELIILMEADLLDETGALSIVWDCMMEGGQDEQSFIKTYCHIKKYSGKILESNPMFTTKAKEIWREKQKLVEEFIRQLGYDLGSLPSKGDETC
jgi:uncharacterized protein